MADEKDRKQTAAAASSSGSGSGEGTHETIKQTGDPGRTPSKAEGDEETVDESLGQKGNG